MASPAFSRGGLLRVPLLVKLAGANGLIVVAALLAASVGPGGGGSDAGTGRLFAVLGVALAAALIVNMVLVTIALRPIRNLQRTARGIWQGDLRSRVPSSAVADADLDRVGDAVNLLLDRLARDRARVRTLAAEVIRAEDRERARIGRELHDSIAQSLAGIGYQLSSAEQSGDHAVLFDTVRSTRAQLADVLLEVGMLSRTVHPRVLEDLGLEAGLQYLARTASEAADGPPVDVDATPAARGILPEVPNESAAVLYRVAQEAVRNAQRHARASRVVIVLDANGDGILMEVNDDGVGFDRSEAEARRPGMGLFTMQERVGLVDGDFDVVTGSGGGTSVRVMVPLPSVILLGAPAGTASDPA